VIVEARAIAERYGLGAYLFEIDHAVASALIGQGDYMAARELLQVMERRLSPVRRMDWAYFHHLQANLEQRLGHLGNAVQAAEQAVTIARETGLPSLQLPHFLARLAHARVAAGNRQGGMRVLDEAIALAGGADRKTFESQRELLHIEQDIDAGETRRAAERLAKVLADHRVRGQTVFLRNRPDLAARLANFALEHGIEPEFVHVLIERNALQAPAVTGKAWPFRLRIRALGGFELIRDGQPMRFAGKAQQRPLDLLKLLVALGGRDVDSQQIMAALWPDADGAAAKTSFDTTLFRLRKLLDVENALVLAGGKLSLARSTCWTDVGAFEALLDVAGRGGDPNATPSTASASSTAHRLLEAYPGALLGTDESAWIVKPRDALRARFVRALVKLGEELERTREWPTAIDVYRRGLEADNLVEPFYRGLMRSLAAAGDRAEALNAFRRCRELLSVVLGLKPSPETERLHREIVAGQVAPRGSASPS
jgi:DNA-binding SARP family transcriptional activator